MPNYEERFVQERIGNKIVALARSAHQSHHPREKWCPSKNGILISAEDLEDLGDGVLTLSSEDLRDFVKIMKELGQRGNPNLEAIEAFLQDVPLQLPL